MRKPEERSRGETRSNDMARSGITLTFVVAGLASGFWKSRDEVHRACVEALAVCLVRHTAPLSGIPLPLESLARNMALLVEVLRIEPGQSAVDVGQIDRDVVDG
jgi:hypothetical protein